MEGAAGFGDEFGASTAFEEFGETQAFGDDPLDGASVFEQTDQQLDEVPDTFEGGSQQLPNVDSNEMGKSKDTGGSQAGHTDPGQWSARTQKMHAMLDASFAESDGQALSFDDMIARTKKDQKRRVVAGCFQELLFLSTHGLIELKQSAPYANIVIAKADGFAAVEVVS
jgi:hypothetical protein